MAKTAHVAKGEALKHSWLFKAMQPAELEEIIRLSSEQRVRRGTSVFQKGDAGSSMMAVLMGRVRISSVSGEGKEITLNVIDAGQVFGEIALLDDKPRSADAMAVEDSLLMVIERRHFLPFLRKNDDLYLRMLSVLCERLRQTSLALEEIALHDVPARLARLLLKLSKDYGRPVNGGGVRIDFKMSQTDMGSLIASTRESVNKQMKQWEKLGVLSTDSRYITLVRPHELAAMVE